MTVHEDKVVLLVKVLFKEHIDGAIGERVAIVGLERLMVEVCFGWKEDVIEHLGLANVQLSLGAHSEVEDAKTFEHVEDYLLKAVHLVASFLVLVLALHDKRYRKVLRHVMNDPRSQVHVRHLENETNKES